MHIFVRSAIALAALSIAAPASAADRTFSITAANKTAEWTSADGSGLNPSNYTDIVPRPETDDRCTKDPTSYCDNALVRVQLSDVGGGTLRFRLEGFKPTSDYDLHVFDADENGPQGEYREMTGDRATPKPAPYPTEVPAPPVWPEQIPADPPSSLPWEDPMTLLATSNGDYETTDVDLSGFVDEFGNVDAYFWVDISYWSVVNDHYTAKIALVDTVPFDPTAGEEEE